VFSLGPQFSHINHFPLSLLPELLPISGTYKWSLPVLHAPSPGCHTPAVSHHHRADCSCPGQARASPRGWARASLLPPCSWPWPWACAPLSPWVKSCHLSESMPPMSQHLRMPFPLFSLFLPNLLAHSVPAPPAPPAPANLQATCFYRAFAPVVLTA
jgi:hypothetical protein